jgi:hypothetical protein
VNFCIVAMKRKSHANATKVFLGFFLANFAILSGKLLKVVTFKYYIHKSYQFETGF